MVKIIFLAFFLLAVLNYNEANNSVERERPENVEESHPKNVKTHVKAAQPVEKQEEENEIKQSEPEQAPQAIEKGKAPVENEQQNELAPVEHQVGPVQQQRTPEEWAKMRLDFDDFLRRQNAIMVAKMNAEAMEGKPEGTKPVHYQECDPTIWSELGLSEQGEKGWYEQKAPNGDEGIVAWGGADKQQCGEFRVIPGGYCLWKAGPIEPMLSFMVQTGYQRGQCEEGVVMTRGQRLLINDEFDPFEGMEDLDSSWEEGEWISDAEDGEFGDLDLSEEEELKPEEGISGPGEASDAVVQTQVAAPPQAKAEEPQVQAEAPQVPVPQVHAEASKAQQKAPKAPHVPKVNAEVPKASETQQLRQRKNTKQGGKLRIPSKLAESPSKMVKMHSPRAILGN